MPTETLGDGAVNTPDAGLTLLLPFIRKQLPADPSLETYAILLVAGFRAGNVKTAITEETLAFSGLSGVSQQDIYDALEDLGRSLGGNPIILPWAPKARIVAIDVHVPEKFGRNLGERYNSMRGRATKTIPTLTVADVSSKHADPVLVDVLEDAGERGPPLLLRIVPILESMGSELTLFDGEFTSKEVSRGFFTEEIAFIGRLRSDSLLAERLKLLMMEEDKLYSMRTLDPEWGGAVTVFGFLRKGRRFYYISNLEAPAEELKRQIGWRWRLENFFRDSSFIDELPGCSGAKATAHAYISSIFGRLTGAFRSTAETVRLLLGTVEEATVSRGRMVVRFRALPKRLVEKLGSYVSYLRGELGVEASLSLIPVGVG